MKLSMPAEPPSGAKAEGAGLRFLRWLIEPPVASMPANLRVVRWLLRATVLGVFVFVAGEVGFDGDTSGGGGGRSGKPRTTPANDTGDHRVDTG